MLTVAGTTGTTRHSGWTFVAQRAQDHSAAIRQVSISREKWHHTPGLVSITLALTGRSDACSELGPRRPLRCSGLGVAVPPPCSELIELFTLLVGVADCCTADFSLMRALEPNAACDAATAPEASFAAWALSAFFLLLKRNAMVPCGGQTPVLGQSDSGLSA